MQTFFGITLILYLLKLSARKGSLFIHSFYPSMGIFHVIGEDPFVILNLFNNKVYADGKEIPTGATLDIYLRVYHITAFCIPSQTRLLAVTNVLDQHNGAYLIGSLGEKLVTNNEWRCVESTNDDDWFEVMYDDRKWPPAHTNPAPTAFPNISQNALSISASPNPSKKYYCRAWIGGKPSISELLTREYTLNSQ